MISSRLDRVHEHRTPKKTFTLNHQNLTRERHRAESMKVNAFPCSVSTDSITLDRIQAQGTTSSSWRVSNSNSKYKWFRKYYNRYLFGSRVPFPVIHAKVIINSNSGMLWISLRIQCGRDKMITWRQPTSASQGRIFIVNYFDLPPKKRQTNK